ncbi:hypothetical protein FRC14_007516 [Serendipita sp. 396]|nr:hypothetical protein FRC14_007516 [Serendipita sp. 396]KAG8786443.1 hypothetical protein FRC15_011405 [Serendipita sp. 397]KAG8840916.1 hypothetical protein FRB91_005533 [Serendipita sp. 411]KAG9056000.1 hypothetical protein FS842_000568 [Serendipita sp. 407]
MDEVRLGSVIYTSCDGLKDEGTQSSLVLAVGEQRYEDSTGSFMDAWCIQKSQKALVVLHGGMGWSRHVVGAEVTGQNHCPKKASDEKDLHLRHTSHIGSINLAITRKF